VWGVEIGLGRCESGESKRSGGTYAASDFWGGGTLVFEGAAGPRPPTPLGRINQRAARRPPPKQQRGEGIQGVCGVGRGRVVEGGCWLTDGLWGSSYAPQKTARHPRISPHTHDVRSKQAAAAAAGGARKNRSKGRRLWASARSGGAGGKRGASQPGRQPRLVLGLGEEE
jgi:hypothetical protein